MLRAIDLVAEFVRDGRDAFISDVKTQDAVIRRIEVIGEAARRLSEATRASQPDIPWSRIVGMRNELAHGYFSVDLNFVWIAAVERLPELRPRVAAMLRAIGD